MGGLAGDEGARATTATINSEGVAVGVTCGRAALVSGATDVAQRDLASRERETVGKDSLADLLNRPQKGTDPRKRAARKSRGVKEWGGGAPLLSRGELPGSPRTVGIIRAIRDGERGD